MASGMTAAAVSILHGARLVVKVKGTCQHVHRCAAAGVFLWHVLLATRNAHQHQCFAWLTISVSIVSALFAS